MSGVRDNEAESRFELDEDGITAIAAYRREGDTIVFTHTEVPPAASGLGIGSRLVRGALDLVRARGLRVDPQCSFVAHYLEVHPDYADMMR